MGYEKTTWNPGAAPGISAANLNKLETQYDEAAVTSQAQVDAHKINAVAPGQHRWGAGKVLFGAGVGADPTEIIIGVPIVVRKTANETVNNSTTYQNDDHLLFAVAANEIWQFDLLLLVTTGATPAIKFNFVAPAGATGYFFSVQSIANSEINDEGAFGTGLIGTGAMSGRLHFRVACILINSTTAGNFQLQWAQLTKEASNTTVHANSCIIAHKLA